MDRFCENMQKPFARFLANNDEVRNAAAAASRLQTFGSKSTDNGTGEKMQNKVC